MNETTVDIVDVYPQRRATMADEAPKKPLTIGTALQATVFQLLPQFIMAIFIMLFSAAFVYWSAYLGEYLTVGPGASAETSSEIPAWGHPIHVFHMLFIQFFLQILPIVMLLFIVGFQKVRKVIIANLIVLFLILIWVFLSRGIWDIGETYYLIPIYIAFFVMVIVDGYCSSRHPKWKFTLFFAYPLLGSAIFLAIYDFTVLPWYAKATESSRFLIRLFVQPIYFSVLMFFSKFFGFRADFWKTSSSNVVSSFNSQEPEPVLGTALILAPLFISIYFGIFFSINLTTIGTFTSAIITDTINFSIRIFLWNKWRLKPYIAKHFPRIFKFIEQQFQWLFYKFEGDERYATFLVYESVFEIGAILLSWLCYVSYVDAFSSNSANIKASLARLFILLGIEIFFELLYVPLLIWHKIPLLSSSVCRKHLPVILFTFFAGTTFVVYRSWLVLAERWWSI